MGDLTREEIKAAILAAERASKAEYQREPTEEELFYKPTSYFVERENKAHVAAFIAELRRLGFVRLTDEVIRKGLAAASWATARMAFLDGVSADGPFMTAAKIEAFRRAVLSEGPTMEANDGT